MKVVLQGSIPAPEQWSGEVICNKEAGGDTNSGDGCGAVLEVTSSDLVLMTFYGTHFQHYYSAVRCPNCGKYNRVKGGVSKPIWETLNMPKNRSRAIFDGHNDSIY